MPAKSTAKANGTPQITERLSKTPEEKVQAGIDAVRNARQALAIALSYFTETDHSDVTQPILDALGSLRAFNADALRPNTNRTEVRD